MAKMNLEKCISALESMYCANIVKIDQTRAAVRKARRRKGLMQNSHADYLSSTLPVRVETAAALGFAIDALRKGVRP